MNRNEAIPAITVSVILIFYAILILTRVSFPFINFLFFISPFLLIWMVYNVIRFGDYKGRELEEDEEWGYADKKK